MTHANTINPFAVFPIVLSGHPSTPTTLFSADHASAMALPHFDADAGSAFEIRDAVNLTMMMSGITRRFKRHSRKSIPRAATPPSPLPKPPKEHGPVFKLFFQNHAAKFIARLVWDPAEVDFSGDAWAKFRDTFSEGGTVQPRAGGRSCFLHNIDNPVTIRLTAIINGALTQKDRTGDEDAVLELGSGDGQLAVIVSRATDAGVCEVDYFAHPHGKRRTIADMRRMDMFRNGQFSVVLSSFAIEYAGPDAFKEAFRILKPGGLLVALVHHQGSAIGMDSSTKFLPTAIEKLYRFIMHARPLRAITPNIILEGWLGTWSRLNEHLNNVSFRSQDDLRRTLRRAGFSGGITIETAMSPPPISAIIPVGRNRRDNVGWIVTVKK